MTLLFGSKQSHKYTSWVRQRPHSDHMDPLGTICYQVQSHTPPVHTIVCVAEPKWTRSDVDMFEKWVRLTVGYVLLRIMVHILYA